MQNVQSPLRRVFITGALVGALSLSSLALVSAQDATATPDPAAEVTAQAEPGFLGVQLANSADGATVDSVLAGSPAEAAGIQANDIIKAVNGDVVDNAEAVAAAIGALMAGDDVALTLDRAGETVEVTATLAGRPIDAGTDTANRQGRGAQEQFRLNAMGLQYNETDQTWTISELSDASALYADGLRSGDVITSIDGSSYDPMALIGYIASLGNDATLTLEVTRGGETVEVSVPATDFMQAGLMGFGMMQVDMPFAQMLPGNGMQLEIPFGQMMPGDGMQFQIPLGQMGQNMNGYLGVSFVTLDETVAAESNASLTDGALLVEVTADSPAATAGLLADDIITAVNGEPVDAEHTLR
ncbi:MAG TPA: PDZ domain-containing protein, partial [Candidatus Limnocylindrales bacterium]|nr:PDZ domain-containing protein [Candidatus Limnocylindrales bacterium]